MDWIDLGDVFVTLSSAWSLQAATNASSAAAKSLAKVTNP